jgi:hypothetical protein
MLRTFGSHRYYLYSENIMTMHLNFKNICFNDEAALCLIDAAIKNKIDFGMDENSTVTFLSGHSYKIQLIDKRYNLIDNPESTQKPEDSTTNRFLAISLQKILNNEGIEADDPMCEKTDAIGAAQLYLPNRKRSAMSQENIDLLCKAGAKIDDSSISDNDSAIDNNAIKKKEFRSKANREITAFVKSMFYPDDDVASICDAMEQLYKPENIIGITQACPKKRPSIYYQCGDLFGHCTLQHYHPDNIGFHLPYRGDDYKRKIKINERTGKEVLFERMPRVDKIHWSRSILVNIESEEDKFKYHEMAIKQFDGKIQPKNKIRLEGLALAKKSVQLDS